MESIFRIRNSGHELSVKCRCLTLVPPLVPSAVPWMVFEPIEEINMPIRITSRTKEAITMQHVDILRIDAIKEPNAVTCYADKKSYLGIISGSI